MPIATTIVGDLYSIEERARIQGLLSSVWGIAAVIGPLAGGLLTQFLTWRWIFFVNMPIGIAAIAVIALYFHEKTEYKVVNIDYLGALLLVAGLGAIMLALLQAGHSWTWTEPRTLSTAGGGFIVMFLFVLDRLFH